MLAHKQLNFFKSPRLFSFPILRYLLFQHCAIDLMSGNNRRKAPLLKAVLPQLMSLNTYGGSLTNVA